MEKRHLISAVAMLLALMLLGLSCGALADGSRIGTLSYLNMSEEEETSIGSALRGPVIKILYQSGVLQEDGKAAPPAGAPVYHHYDSLNAMLMTLQSGEIDALRVPYYTAKYLCSTNDGMELTAEYHPEKATGFAETALSMISDGYSFMTKEDNAALRDAFDAQISAMKEDGTLQKLIDEHIVKVSEGGEPAVIAFEEFEGDPIKVAVTGSLPPMDYVAPDGSFAGFNTAVLAEIGKRLQKNIELVQVDSIGRALALSEGTVDVVFWTRGLSENQAGRRVDNPSKEELEALRAEYRAKMTDEEKAILDEAASVGREAIRKMDGRDIPAGTIITQPYFSDFPVMVTLK